MWPAETRRSASSSSETVLFLPRHPTRPCGKGFWESSSHYQGQHVNSLTTWSGTHTHTDTHRHTDTHTHRGAHTHTLKRLPAGIHKETTNEAERREEGTLSEQIDGKTEGHRSLFPSLTLSPSLLLYLSLFLCLYLTHSHTHTSITLYWISIKNVHLQHASVYRLDSYQPSLEEGIPL